MSVTKSIDTNYDAAELKKFASLAAHWWDPEGELKTLHQVNPIRVCFITEKVSIANQSIIDIGCGGGILTERLAELGASVTGIDLNQSVIDVAKLHLLEKKSAWQTPPEYLCISAETMAEQRQAQYDIVTCFELLEHVPDPVSIIKACAKLVKPGGHIFLSTLNRTMKSYFFAIIGAEYILNLLPKNTHDYAKFIRPAELTRWLRDSNITLQEIKGITYHPLTKQFSLTNDISINYLMYAERPMS